MIFQQFKTKVRFGFCHQLLLKFARVRGKRKKTLLRDKFSGFGNLEIDLVINIQAGIYLIKVNNRNTRTSCEIFSKLAVTTTERCQWLYC